MSEVEVPREISYGEVLLKSGKFADVDIKTATRTIKAHKCVLARLPFFEKLLEFNTANFGSVRKVDSLWLSTYKY